MLDRAAAGEDGTARIEAALRGGVDWLQLRDRSLEGGALLDWTRSVLRATRAAAAREGCPVRVLVNRRIDVAHAAGADGVHLGGDALDAGTARLLLGAAAWIGVSCHAPEEAQVLAGADYALLAPLHAPLSKTSARAPLGVAALARACAASTVPLLAQGGITPDRVADCLRAGAAGVAVSGAIAQAVDPAEAARALRRALDAARD